jgi:hypothetical protein
MAKHVNFISLFALCLAASGCFPYHYTDRPGISGRVVNARTREPLAGASISFGLTNTVAVAISSADGSFVVSPKRQWGIWIIPQDVFSFPWTVCVRHSGYESNYIRFPFNAAATGKAAKKALGVISLEPVSQ